MFRLSRLLPIALCLFFSNPFFGQHDARQVVSGIVLKNDKAALPTADFLQSLKNDWGLQPDSVTEKDGTVVFYAGNALVMLAQLDYPVSTTDLAAPIGISWLWKNARAEVPLHQSQLVISVMSNGIPPLQLYMIFTRVAACALDHSNASGLFMNNQYLLLPKGFYLESARNMTDTALPAYLWVYFGMLQDGKQSSGYTYGLSAFGLQEMEVFNSARSVSEVHAFLYDVAQDCLLKNRQLQAGETVRGTGSSDIPVKIDKAKMIEGTTIQLLF